MNPQKFASERGHPILRLIILKMIQQRPMTGYDLLKEFERKTENQWVPSKGTIYPVLRQLEGEGYVRVKKLGGRAKRLYETTAKADRMLKPFPLSGDFLRRNEKFVMMFFSLFHSEEERRVMEVAFRISALSTSLLKSQKRRVFAALDGCVSTLEGLKLEERS